MELCELCKINDRTNLLTKCCQHFCCYDCRERLEKATVCSCGKPTNKKWCEPQPKLYQALVDFYAGKTVECIRCDETAGLCYCQECESIFCDNCFSEVHSKGTYEMHRRCPKQTVRKALQERRNSTNKEETCHDHRAKKEYICECSLQPMCSHCLRTHRDTCSRKYRGLSDYKKEYFSGMLNKLQKLTDCKEHLKKNCRTYRQHFEEQRKLKESCEEFIKETFSNIDKLLEFKKAELIRSLDKYWQECSLVYQRNLASAEEEDKKYDDYGRLIEKLADKAIGIDYLERRIVRKSLTCEAFAFRLCGLEAMEKEIMAITVFTKKWESEAAQEQENPPLRNRKLSSVFDNQTPQILTQIHEDPLHSRPLKLVASSTDIQYEFIHLPYQKEEYEIEFGVGMKVKGQEVFKRIKADSNGKGIINGLNPQTTYRVRMRVINGMWGSINEVTTLQSQCFITNNCSFAKGDNKGTVMFLKSGTLYAANPLEFGTHTWEIKLMVDKNSHAESETACISLGVSNRQSKKALFVGSTLNYGYQRQNFKVRIVVDCGEGKMTISNDKQQEEEVYQNIPDLPLFPTIVNKGNSTVQVNIQFLQAA